MKQALRACFHQFSCFLLHLGFTCNTVDSSIFVYARSNIILDLFLYVDDIVVTGNNTPFLRNFIQQLHREFATNDLGTLNYYLGLEVSSFANGLFLSQAKYAHNILAHAQLLDCKPTTTLMVVSKQLSNDGDAFTNPTLYHSMVGALQYLTITHPDLTHVVNFVNRYMQSPTVHHFQTLKCILRYVKGTLHYGLYFSSFSPTSLTTYSDADWAGCPDTHCSTSSYAMFLGDNLISWSAKKQPTISRSSCESEHRVLAHTASKVVWITHLLRDLKVSLSHKSLLLCDNKSAIFLTLILVSYKRLKHIALDYHFIHELAKSGVIQPQSVPSHLQITDIFTKSLSQMLFTFFFSKLRVRVNLTLSLQRDDKESNISRYPP